MPESFRSVSCPDEGVARRSHTRWGVELGGFRCAVTRTRETCNQPSALRRSASRARAFTAGALTGIGGVTLLVVGASAAPGVFTPVRYLVSVPVPDVVSHAVRTAPRKAAPGRATRSSPVADAFTGDRFAAADEPYVARAMATGAFQEWEGADGLPRFLTAGPAHPGNGRVCRDLALLVRLADGGSHVRSAERCTTGPISDAPSVASGAEAYE